MRAVLTIGERTFTADLSRGRSIAIPLRFNGPQPNSYGVPAASSTPFEGGGFVGDTRRGGSCNFETFTLTPHCNGTHTECVGHITADRLAVPDILAPSLLPATLISVDTVPALQSPDSYFLVKEEEDRIITAAAIDRALDGADPAFLEALVIRTRPNGEEKLRRQYMEEPAPFFSVEAMLAVLRRGVRHILVDIPSLDRAFDEGNMSVHRLYWDIDPGSFAPGPDGPSSRTVTEMIYVPDDIADGRYLLDLQIAPFMADAAPSRPVLYPFVP